MLQGLPGVQILFLMIFSVVQQSLILKAQPFQENNQNKITFLNELAVTVYLYLTIILTDYFEEKTDSMSDNSFRTNIRLMTAWSQSVLLTSAICFNLIV